MPMAVASRTEGSLPATAGSAPPDVDAVELGEVLVGAWHTFTRRASARFSQHGLSAARVRVIVALGRGEKLRMGVLAEQLSVTGRTITALIDALEAEGIVAREPDPRDRRALRLALTDEGKRVLRKIRKLQQEVSEEVFTTFSPTQRAELAALLRLFTQGPPKPDDDPYSAQCD
jgi:DNA-binding MarR family transcriptional regulator